MFALLFSKTVRRVLAAVVLLVLAVPVGTAAHVWWTARSDDRSRSDVIVVLGASQFDGRPSSVLEARLEHARTLFRGGVAPRIVTVGGGREGDRFTEAQAGDLYLRKRGVDRTKILAVGKGSDTLQSLRALDVVMRQHGWKSVVLVTDPWHSLRSRTMARDLGLTAVTSPTRAGPSVRSRSTEVRYIARETAAYLYYRTFGSSAGEGAPRAV
ncbi:MAG: EpiH/GdmH-related protein [Frankiales bacterium]|nr:EpiH/GdmH-related protein [Frankiales bacterium]